MTKAACPHQVAVVPVAAGVAPTGEGAAGLAAAGAAAVFSFAARAFVESTNANGTKANGTKANGTTAQIETLSLFMKSPGTGYLAGRQCSPLPGHWDANWYPGLNQKSRGLTAQDPSIIAAGSPKGAAGNGQAERTS